ncbi:hypothetical protein [Taibaiella koreensis]|uniref:hypothetical protein n=1 Tax=Taibaiella koreensis TaxID=1268548 RepID=UPI000E59A9E6|nr:hypothetical protein [Taibaiella koreensis]
MTTTIIIVAVMVSLSVAYIIFMNARRKKLLGDYNADNQYHRAAELLPSIMSDRLDQIRHQMNGNAVDAITECAHITNIGQQAASAAITAAKTVAWAAVGVKAKYRTADHASYLVLSGDDLHYILFQEGELSDHQVFDRYELSTAKLDRTSASDKVTRMGSAMGRKTQKLTLDKEGKKMEILFYDRITRLPGGPLSPFSGDVFKTMVDFEIMGKYFKERLGNKYHQLQAS